MRKLNWSLLVFCVASMSMRLSASCANDRVANIKNVESTSQIQARLITSGIFTTYVHGQSVTASMAVSGMLVSGDAAQVLRREEERLISSAQSAEALNRAPRTGPKKGEAPCQIDSQGLRDDPAGNEQEENCGDVNTSQPISLSRPEIREFAFDDCSGLVLWLGHRGVSIGEWIRPSLTLQFSDYRKVNGYVIPFRVKGLVGQNVEWNLELGEVIGQGTGLSETQSIKEVIEWSVASSKTAPGRLMERSAGFTQEAVLKESIH